MTLDPRGLNVNVDAKQVFTYVLLGLIALVVWFAKAELARLTEAVNATTLRVEGVAADINAHSTQLQLLNLRVTRLEQREGK